MDFVNLKSLNLTTEESEGIIKFLAQKRGITTKKLLSTIKLNLKRKNNKDLTSKSQQKLIKSIKSQQKLAKTQLALIKSQQKLIKSIKLQQKLTKQTKSQRELIRSQRKLKRLIKPQQTLSNTKEIRNHLYNNDDFIENVRDLFNIENSNELDNINNSNELDNNNNLFNIVNYEPILIKTGFDNNNNYYYNYLEYRSEGNNLLSFEEYLNLIKPYLNDLIIKRMKVNGNYNYQLKFLLFHKNLALMRSV